MTPPRSPMPRSPMPKSPMPKSPMICEKYETGCMWHLYGLFNFRQGRSNKKLLSHQSHLTRTDDGNFKTKLDLLNKMDEKSENMGDAMKNKTQTVDSNMTSTRKLKGEELSTELQINKKIATDEVKHMQSDSKFVCPLPKNNGKTSNNRQRSNEIPLHGLKNETKHRKPPSSTSVEKPHSAALPEVLSKEVHRKKRTGCGCKSIDYVKYDQLNENNLPPGQMNAAEAIVSQKFINGVNYQSKQFSDALQILNSNKELFIKLLQDPNSLLVKHIEDLRESQARKHQSKSVCEENISEQRTSKARQSEGPSGIHKLNSCDIYPSQASGDCGFSERIVVLTPTAPRLQNSSDGFDSCSSIQSYYSLRSNGESERPANISLSRIKRKLKRAIGVSSKEQDSKTINGTLQISPCQGSEDDSKGKGVEIIRRNSPGSNNAADSGVALDIENRVNISKVNEGESNIGCEAASTSGCGLQNSNISLASQPKRKESETFAEAMEHLSELLTKGKKDKNNFERQAQKTWEKVASFPEYDFLPTHSPARDWENTFVDEPMRFSPYSNYQLVYENKSRLQKEKKTCYSSPLRQDVEAMPENKKLDDQLQVIDIQRNIHTRGLGDNSRLKGCVQIVKNNSTAHRGETNSIGVSSMRPGEPSSLEVLTKPDSMEKTNTTETSDATCQGETDPFEDQPLTSSPDVFSATPIIQRVESSDNIEDKREQPSPVSVLEHYYLDVTSPASTISEPAEELQSQPLTRSPLYIETSSLSEHQVISEYVRAVLQASSLNWDELSLMWHSSDQLLDPFLFDAVKLQAYQFSDDCMLLFDCINEVLVEVYHTQLPYSPWVSFIKPIASRQLSIEKTVIHEVMKSVDWYLLPHSSPRKLQKIVEKDITSSGTWLDLRNDSEEVVFEMVEDVLEELIMETIF
ncbi:hypothetical protein D8674_011809 [Pyrus ussuriensis x Pyrus communis]|uniref:DUF4378 domain-containing protein n=1 Tax=Pyrus ussuriensis x Pyrus communis TaxID=2448454 RepID=A0A5N5G4F4_9ROSA|nr:hypothetical protein D8674_011809 [Pyrus ussuriensis x Pyrus communis]